VRSMEVTIWAMLTLIVSQDRTRGERRTGYQRHRAQKTLRLGRKRCREERPDEWDPNCWCESMGVSRLCYPGWYVISLTITVDSPSLPSSDQAHSYSYVDM
jgi:hypothetical protein